MHSVSQLRDGLRTTRRTTCLSFPASPIKARVACSRRPSTVIRASKRSSKNENTDSSESGSHEVARGPSSRETAADSSSAANNTPPQPGPAETPATPQARPPVREIDVNRAVRLLKITSQRSSKSVCKLPPWLARTRDPAAWGDSEQLVSFRPDSTAASDFPGGAGSDNSSKQYSPEDAASASDASSPLDSYMALPEQNSAAIDDQRTQNGINRDAARYSSSGSSTSRPRSPASTTATAATGPTALNARMFNASDPVLRSSGRQLSSPGGFSMLLEGSTDAAKEQERQFRRAVFSFDRWAAHRSTARYTRHFKGIFSSRTFQGLLQPMSFLTGMAVLCGLYNVYAIPKGAPPLVISSTPLDITAFAVSLLLVFRTDSSYARWKEALQTWNEVRSLSKDLARQSCYWVDEPARKGMLVRWCEAFSRALLVHCRVDGNLQHELEDVLLPHEVAAVAAVGPSGAPSFVLQVLAELIEQCTVTETKEDTMFSTVRALSDSVAVCNKLLRYPLPLAYTRHTSRFMFLWLSAMPWAMWSDMHWSCVPVTAAISYLLLGIDEIGVQIEEPFGILPLEDVCVDIVAEIDAMMERQDIVTDLLAAGGVDCAPRSMCGECGQPLATAAAASYSASSSFGSSSGESSSGRGSGSDSDSSSSSSSSNDAKEVRLNGSQPILGRDFSAAASPAAAGLAATLPDTGSSSSGVIVSSSASNGAGGISRITKSGSPQGLVARWVSSTISGSAESASDPLSSLEDAVAPGFDLRGFVVRDPEGVDDQQRRRLDRRGWAEVSSLKSLDVDINSSSSSSSDGGVSKSISRLGWYQRQPTPTADHKYPD